MMKFLEGRAEPQGRVSEVEPGCRRTEMKAERLNSKVELEERKSPLDPKGWRYEVQLKARKSIAQTEGRLTEEEPEGRGDICPSWSQGREKWSHNGANCSTGLGGVVGTEILCGAPGSTIQDGAGKFSDRGKSLATRTGAKGLRRGNSGRAKGGLGSAGGVNRQP